CRRSAPPRHRVTWEPCAGSSGAAAAPSRPAAPSSESASGPARWRPGGGRGSEVSLGGLRQDLLVQREIGNRLAQPHVLTLQLLQPLGLVHLQAAIFLAPAIVGLLRHPDRLAERPTPTHQNLHLTQLADDLLGRMPFLGHLPLPPQWPN